MKKVSGWCAGIAVFCVVAGCGGETMAPTDGGLAGDGGRGDGAVGDAGPVDAAGTDAQRDVGGGAVCGNGVMEAGEECDFGAGNSDVIANRCRTSCHDPSCGDSVVDDGESCDDGAGNSDTTADACRTSCVPARCGDGVLDGAEACDDGAANGNDPGACRASCVLPACGDGVVDPPEGCDEGAANSDSAPNACRTSCELPTCGDAVVDTSEACDDGNDRAGDGCAACVFEPSCALGLVVGGSGGASLVSARIDATSRRLVANGAPQSFGVTPASFTSLQMLAVCGLEAYAILPGSVAMAHARIAANGTLSAPTGAPLSGVVAIACHPGAPVLHALIAGLGSTFVHAAFPIRADGSLGTPIATPTTLVATPVSGTTFIARIVPHADGSLWALSTFATGPAGGASRIVRLVPGATTYTEVEAQAPTSGFLFSAAGPVGDRTVLGTTDGTVGGAIVASRPDGTLPPAIAHTPLIGLGGFLEMAMPPDGSFFVVAGIAGGNGAWAPISPAGVIGSVAALPGAPFSLATSIDSQYVVAGTTTDMTLIEMGDASVTAVHSLPVGGLVIDVETFACMP